MVTCAIGLLAFPQAAASGQTKTPQAKVQGLIACTGKLVRLTGHEAAVVAVDQTGGKPPLNSTFDLTRDPLLDALPGDRVDLIYAPSKPRNIVVVLLKVSNIDFSEPHHAEPLGIAEMKVPEQLTVDVLDRVGGISVRGPGTDWELYDNNKLLATTGGGGGEGNQFKPTGVVSHIQWLNPLETEVVVATTPDAQGVSKSETFIVNWLTNVVGPVVKKGSVVEIESKREGGRNIATLIIIG